VQQVLAQQEVQWMLFFLLACICQQLHSKKQQKQQSLQQQLQQQQPNSCCYEQLFAALGLPASLQYNSYFGFSDSTLDVELWLCANAVQSIAAESYQSFLYKAGAADSSADQVTAAAAKQLATTASAVDGEGAIDTAAAVAALASDVASVVTLQQQQQQQQDDQLYLTVPLHLLQPLVLTLLQLCTELNSAPSILMLSLQAAVAAIQDCKKALTDCCRAAGVDPHAPVAGCPENAQAVRGAFIGTVSAVTKPLLHKLGPTVLKTVQQIEQGLSKGKVSSRIRVPPGKTAEQSAESIEGPLMHAFGDLVLLVISAGERDLRFYGPAVMLVN
jgi:hypothetical protein